MSKLKTVSKVIAGVIAITIFTGCGRNNTTAPNIPLRQYTQPNYTNTTSDFGPSLPQGTTPVEMKFSGLTEKETEDGHATLPVGKIKQLFVDIKLNNGQILRNYNAVTWQVVNSDVGSINNRGIFTPLREGRTKVTATIGGVSASFEIVISSSQNIWAQVIAPTNRNLLDVKIVNEQEAWAVGQGGTILHYMNGNWIDETTMSGNPTGADLTGVDVTDSGTAWAVGGSTILQNNGGRWEVFPYNAGGTLKAIDMIHDNDGWIVGTKADGDALVLRYTGGSWQPVETKIDGDLNTVSALGPSEVWVGGKSRLLGSPSIYKYDGNEWKKSRFGDSWTRVLKVWDGKYEVKSIKMLNSTQGWAVGEYSPLLSSLRGNRGFMFYYDAIKDTWIRGSYDKSKPELEQVPLKDVGMISGGRGWVLGTNTPPNRLFNKEVVEIPGSFLSNDGKNLKIDTQYQANTVGKSFNSIDIYPNGNGIVVGDNGFIMHHQYDLSRPSYYNNAGSYSSYNNYGSPSSYAADTYNNYPNYGSGYGGY